VAAITLKSGVRYLAALGCAALIAFLAFAYLAGTRSTPLAAGRAPAVAAVRTAPVRPARPISDSDEIVGHPDDGIVALPERGARRRPR
jgi:hypothetical protein